MKHARWTRAGRRLLLPTGQHVYKGYVGQQNIELDDGSFAPFVWDDRAKTLRYGDVEARFSLWGISFWRGGELQAITRPWLQRKDGDSWVDVQAVPRVERLSDEDNLRAWACARIAITLEADGVIARHVLVAGGRPKARADIEIDARAVGEYRVVVDHDLGAMPEVPDLSSGAVGWIAPNGWRVAWTDEEDLDRLVTRTARGLRVELPSIVVAALARPARLRISPDTYGPVSISVEDHDSLSDSTAYSNTGVVSGAGYVNHLFLDDSNSPAPQVCASLRFDSVDFDGYIGSIDAGTQLSCDRTGGAGDGGNNRVISWRCVRSNTPAVGADTANTSTGRPFLRSYFSRQSLHTYNQGVDTQVVNVRDAIDSLRLESYSYNGSVGEAIMLGAGANTLFGITSVSWAHLAADLSHATTNPAELTVVFTLPGPPAQIKASSDRFYREFPERSARTGLIDGRDNSAFRPAIDVWSKEFFEPRLLGTTGATLDALTATATGTLASGGGINGTLTSTLGALTSAAAGVLPIAGTCAATLGALTSSAAGTLAIAGTCAATLGALTTSTAGAVAIAGSCSATLGALTLTAAGTGPTAITGDLAATLGALTASAAGTLPIVGTASPTLGALSTSAAGVLPIAGSATLTLGTATTAAAGTLPIVGTSSITLEALTGAASGAANANTGTANATLGALTSAAAGVLPIAGVASVSLEAATASASGALALVGVCAATLAPLAKTGTGTLRIAGTCAPTLAAVSTTATGALPLVAACSRTLDALSVSASGVSTAITVGELATTLAPVGVSASATLPIAGTVSTTLASLTAAAAGKVAVAGTATATLGELAASASARLSVAAALAGQLGDSGLSAAGTIAVLGALSRTLADLGLVALGSGPGETPTFPIELESRDAIAIILSRPAVAMVTENDAVASISKARASAAITSEPAIVVVRPNRATVEVS